MSYYTKEQKKQLLQVISAPNFLHPELVPIAYDLMRSIVQQRLPFMIYETYRTPQRQKKLISLGYSKEKNFLDNKHVHGLAFDFMIIDRYVTKSNKDDILKMLSAGDPNQESDIRRKPFTYNIGVNVLPLNGKPPRTIVESNNVLNWWNRLGEIIKVQFPELSWGGDKDKSASQLIGRDPMHVELRQADKIIKSSNTIAILRENGNPGLEGL